MLRPEEASALPHAQGAVLAIGDDGRISFATLEALALLGWDQGLVGQPLPSLVPERHREQYSRRLHAAVVSHRPQLHFPREPFRAKDGTERELDWAIVRFRRPDASVFLCIALAPAGTQLPAPGPLERHLSQASYARLPGRNQDTPS